MGNIYEKRDSFEIFEATVYELNCGIGSIFVLLLIKGLSFRSVLRGQLIDFQL